MKKLNLFLITLLLIIATSYLNSYAQLQNELWGMTSVGGEYNLGTIFKTDGNGDSLSVQYSFPFIDATYPYFTSLCQATSGKLYGMTSEGGVNDMGVLFEYDPSTNNFVKKLDFDSVNGSYPLGSLVLASNGMLYGMTSSGGDSNMGVLFEYDPALNIYTKKLDFIGTATGSGPQGSLAQASNGKLYGMTYGGGSNNIGIIFEYDPVLDTLIDRFDFDGTKYGCKPNGDLVQASNGKLYGMAFAGGADNLGTLFEYDPLLDTCIKKLDFNGANLGAAPEGSLVMASNGKFYGMTSQGGMNNKGVLFEYDPLTQTYIKKKNFSGAGNGSDPYGSLVQASNGKLYGMTSSGGINNLGVIFEYDFVTEILSKKIDFDGLNYGSNPYSSLMQASNGNLYGMTNMGGATDQGVLFAYDPVSDTVVKKFDFNSASYGSNPNGSLMQAQNGKLYGMAFNGGINDKGVLFEYDQINNVYTKLFDFDGTNYGSYPDGSLLQATNGKLYAVTVKGGTNNMGAFFEYDPATYTFAKKFDFDGVNNGRAPIGSLIQAYGGRIYGMTNRGGINNMGVFFEYNIASAICTNKFNFDGINTGSNPFGSLIQVSNGKLYGMTSGGGANGKGALIEYDTATNLCDIKWDFDGPNTGSNPNGSLVQASNGKLYGLTSNGGANNIGVLFEYDPVMVTVTNMVDFDGINYGSRPYGSLMQAANGKLYGLTSSGSMFGMGVLLEYDPFTVTFINKHDFTGLDGAIPQYTQLIEICAQPQITAVLAGDTVCTGSSTHFIVTAIGNGLTYQWQANSGGGYSDISNSSIYSGATTDSLTITGAPALMDDYHYRCLVTSNCPVKTIISDSSILTVDPCTGIKPETPSKDIVVYPNPNTGSFNITMPTSEVNRIRIFNSLGAPVYQTSAVYQSSLQVDMHNLPQGIYYLEVTNSKQTKRFKLIVQ